VVLLAADCTAVLSELTLVLYCCCTAGVLLPRSELEAAARMCAAAGCWLVLDNTYEDFVYGDRTHHSLSGPNVLNIFSFSKAYGMMG
jgi:aspartate/methionine/tyrosine aminotransferase